MEFNGSLTQNNALSNAASTMLPVWRDLENHTEIEDEVTDSN